MDIVKQANKIIRDALATLDEKDQEGLKYRGLSGSEIIGNASAMVNKHEGKAALLKVWSVSEANRLCSFVWRKGMMTEELEKEYRELPTIEEAGEDFKNFSDKRKVVADELEQQKKSFSDEDRDLQIFQAVLSGVSKKEAEKEMDVYQKQAQSSMKG